MSRYLPGRGIFEGRFKGTNRAKKRNLLLIIILAIMARLFFSVLFGDKVMAKNEVSEKKMDIESLDPLKRISKLMKKESKDKKICEKIKQEAKNEKYENPQREKYEKLVKNHPIEIMLPEIAKYEKNVAAFLIGIAKKESDWGKHSPKKDGRDCYNYWGYRGGYNPTDSGYSCFDNPDQAVGIVGERIRGLILKKIDTPERMIVWKCGRSCAGHSPRSVGKWISDVSLYYDQLM